jgi:23S rRNA pseudoU1915 N3-methylase RlmH
MNKIIIISDSNKHFDIPIKEYEKRLGKNLEIIKIKPIKKGTQKKIIEFETEELIKKIEKNKGFKIVLNPA